MAVGLEECFVMVVVWIVMVVLVVLFAVMVVVLVVVCHHLSEGGLTALPGLHRFP